MHITIQSFCAQKDTAQLSVHTDTAPLRVQTAQDITQRIIPALKPIRDGPSDGFSYRSLPAPRWYIALEWPACAQAAALETPSVWVSQLMGSGEVIPVII